MKRVRTATGGASAVTVLPRVFTRSPGALGEGEYLVLEVGQVTLSVGEETFGEGTLRVTSARILWKKGGEKEGAGKGAASMAASGGEEEEEEEPYTLQYQRVVLHAVCRDVEAFPVPCMYLQVTSVGSVAGPAGNEEEMETLDVYFAPHTPASLDDLFTAMTKCAELHPDAAEEQGGEGDEGMFSMGAGGGIISGGYDWADKLLAQAGGGRWCGNSLRTSKN
jgi:hypothetical protein